MVGFSDSIIVIQNSMRQLLSTLPLVLSLVLAGCNTNSLNPTTPENKSLQVWWSEGYYPEETDAIQSTINEWEKTSQSDVELTFYSEKDLIQQAQNAIAAGKPPDIIYGYSIDLVLVPKLAWNDKLVEVSSVINPLKNDFSPEAIESVSYFNKQTNDRGYYAVPISQQTTHIHYWKDLLAESGVAPGPLSTNWSTFWQTWKSAQESLHKKGLTDTYGIGFPMSLAATDTFTVFEQFLEAYNVQLLDTKGQLRVNEPNVRQGLIEALEAYTNPYLQGFVPPKATEWSDPDNNVQFLSNLTLMTANASLSIPGSQRRDDINYFERMRTTLWPNKPDNSPMRHVTSVKQIAIFKQSSKVDQAKSLVSFIVQPDNLTTYVEGAQGRFFPVMPAIAKRPFWTDPKDPHITVAAQQFKNTRASSVVLNPAYSEVLAQNIWGEAIQSITVDKVPVEKAADKAIEKIQDIFSQWK